MVLLHPPSSQPMPRKQKIGERDVFKFLDTLFGKDLHAKRVLSLSHATLGAIHSASLAIHLIGIGMAEARGVLPKHAIKQVDGLLSNNGINVWKIFARPPRTVPSPRRFSTH